MCKVGKFLKKELVKCHAEIENKEDLFLFLAENIAKNSNISKDDVFRRITERESYGSTGIGKGVAVPHCRVSGSKDVIIQVVSLAKSISYGSNDGEGVQLVFMLVVPEGNNLLYLKLISQISVLCSNQKVREGLMSAKTSEEMIDLISNL